MYVVKSNTLTITSKFSCYLAVLLYFPMMHLLLDFEEHLAENSKLGLCQTLKSNWYYDQRLQSQYTGCQTLKSTWVEDRKIASNW